MSATLKNSLIIILILIVALLSYKLFVSDLFTKKDNSKIDSTIVIEKIQKVMKMVAVEGNYTELMKYNDFDYIDFPGFRKDALIRVNAKVSVGYNLENMQIRAEEKDKTISIVQMPKPEIISIDTDIKFENLSSGLFTGFSEAELTKLNSLAKDKIKQKALNPELVKQAEEQKKDLLDLLFYMTKQNGYTIKIENKELQPIQSID